MSNRTPTADDRSWVRQLSDSVGVFFVLALDVGAVGNAVLERLEAGDLVLDGGPVGWLVIVIPIVVAGAVTVWLDDGGYERLGADPTAGGRFAWLALVYVPFATLPTLVALDAVWSATWTAQVVSVVFAAAVAAWLAFYGGLDRLGIEPRHAGRVAVVGTVSVLVAGVVGLVAFPDALDDPWVVVPGALAIQALALWEGLRGRLGDPR